MSSCPACQGVPFGGFPCETCGGSGNAPSLEHVNVRAAEQGERPRSMGELRLMRFDGLARLARTLGNERPGHFTADELRGWIFARQAYLARREAA